MPKQNIYHTDLRNLITTYHNFIHFVGRACDCPQVSRHTSPLPYQHDFLHPKINISSVYDFNIFQKG
jgi:hypothetical protein